MNLYDIAPRCPFQYCFMEKILSIIIPTYNMEKYLRKCLDSLIVEDKELFGQLEVLVINDGSKDSSSAIAHEYQDKYPNVFRTVDKENGNYGSCVNRGLKEATGKFFRLLDADDWFDNDQLKQFIQMLRDVDSDIVITGYTKVEKGKSNHIHSHLVEYNSVYEVDNCDAAKLKLKELLVMHAMTYRTSLLRNINLQLQTGISYTDIEYCYFPMSKAETIVFLDLNLYQYSIGREGQTMQKGNLIKDGRHLFMVSERVISDYLKCDSFSQTRQLALRYIIANPVYQLFAIYLIYSRKPTEEAIQHYSAINSLVGGNADLAKMVMNFTYKKIPFVKLWNYAHIRLGRLVGE